MHYSELKGILDELDFYLPVDLVTAKVTLGMSLTLSHLVPGQIIGGDLVPMLLANLTHIRCAQISCETS